MPLKHIYDSRDSVVTATKFLAEIKPHTNQSSTLTRAPTEAGILGLSKEVINGAWDRVKKRGPSSDSAGLSSHMLS